MKALLIISLLLGHTSVVDSTVVDQINRALQKGEVNLLDQYYASAVDVTILDYQGFLDKSATAEKVNKFFNSRTISKYEILHEGKSKGMDSVYTIGKLFTNEGNYRVYMFISSKNGSDRIEEIKIEE